MQEKLIKISIDPIGRPTVEAQGFTGSDCLKATEALENALSGNKSVEKEYKPEFYQNETSAVQELRY